LVVQNVNSYKGTGLKWPQKSYLFHVKKNAELIVNLSVSSDVYAEITGAGYVHDGISMAEKSGHSCIFDMDVSSCNSAGG